ncbi:hypothetical protein ANN_04362 [Periplaneta americana]|uniref:Uncharacterized protein n=1 Tax=Periplaneta americana TaxID=6978 RepID=A0ABQ8TAR2_PERAM|nr:hypothetical protein ANN_04362 [Periplaneta americana]
MNYSVGASLLDEESPMNDSESEENQIARNGLLPTTTPDANDVQILKAVDHDHPPLLEEVESLRRCIRLKRSAENEPVAGLAQIIQLELEGVRSGVLPFLCVSH